ncbi:tripartite tricarboxylate transporter TctB family protein [Niallia oryzisoli]|uniref:Tripartite tricarboxylate transporter TctB family protein n=1 Tax=Niallia oryzisoli TaxID=1737571 RepID=A0ABZ2CJV0_9BACI
MTSKLLSEKRMGGLIAAMFGLLSLNEAKMLYPYSKNILTGDHVFPVFIGALLLLFGLCLGFEQSNEEYKADLPSGKTRFTLMSCIASLFVYCFFITIIGYAASTFIISVCLLKVIGQYRWNVSLLLGVMLTSVIYFLFIVLLKTPLPSGFFTN